MSFEFTPAVHANWYKKITWKDKKKQREWRV